MSEGTHHEGAGMMATLQKILLPPMKFDPSCKYDQSLVDNAKPHHREAVKLALTDLYGVRHEALIRLPSSWERALCDRVLNDPRDLRLFLTFLQCFWATLILKAVAKKAAGKEDLSKEYRN